MGIDQHINSKKSTCRGFCAILVHNVIPDEYYAALIESPEDLVIEVQIFLRTILMNNRREEDKVRSCRQLIFIKVSCNKLYTIGQLLISDPFLSYRDDTFKVKYDGFQRRIFTKKGYGICARCRTYIQEPFKSTCIIGLSYLPRQGPRRHMHGIHKDSPVPFAKLETGFRLCSRPFPDNLCKAAPPIPDMGHVKDHGEDCFRMV